MQKKAVLALGGNAILKAGQKGTVEEQKINTYESMKGIVKLIREGYHLAITHGNGPQVGNMLIQQQAGINMNIAPLPLMFLNAATEGTMGYMIEECLENGLAKENLDVKVLTVVTRVQVDKNDPNFQNPSKPVGPFYNKETADKLKSEYGWHIVEDAGRGYRQVVPSPIPIDIPLASTIKELVEEGVIVIACGGGGIPFIINDDGKLEGIDAVIDKDFASALLAEEIEADLLVILTGVDKVSINFGKADQQDLDVLTLAEAEKYLAEGQFPPGSMGPKIRAAVNFIKKGGKEVVITSVERVVDALHGETGTIIKA
ncbi:MAG: carbamate kinase [Candidatus Cloacimonetes bacterium]|nr:carbamate kinase [Candidatus Cloacimonadota bacterium]